MTTLDNLNENIVIKIDYINKLTNILIDKINLFKFTEVDKHVSTSEVNTKINLDFIKNVNLLRNKYNEVKDKIYIYEISSILFLTEYYSVINTNQLTDLQVNKKNIYNDAIFLLDIKNGKTVIDNEEIMNLKNIYYSNYYQYKHENNILKNNLSKNVKFNKNLSKTIYNKFNIFISSNDIYGIFDNFVEYINEFIITYQSLLEEYNVKFLNNNKDDIEKLFKKISIISNHFNKTKLIYNIDEIDYDVCQCGNKMAIQSNTSELLCIKCGFVHTLIGSVFEDSQFFNQEGNRYKHGSYDPNRHCKFWIERIQAKENTVIDQSLIDKIEKCIKKDKIENIKNISVKQFRLYLKQTNLSRLNDHIPLIKKIITGYIPPQLTHNELHLLFNYFDKATKTYESIKPSSKKNSLYYPFLIYKILEIIIEDEGRKLGLLGCIHLQSYETLIDNDKIWASICKNNKYFVYKPTNKLDLH
jgi:hypothetical protein